jgi:L-lactate dehydrogenase complex protein LldE
MRVAFFATCLADQVMPDAAEAAFEVLERLGVAVEFPEAQTCCGQPAYNAGYHAEARSVALHHIRLFEGYDRVVLPSGSCSSMLVAHVPELFREQPEHWAAARSLAERTVEWSDFIVEGLGVTDLGADLSGERITVHDGCHGLRTLGGGRSARRLLQAAGAELVEAQGHDTCCGFGGLFAVKMPEVSGAMARAKHEGIDRSGASVLTSTDVGCLLHLDGSLQRRAREGGAPAPRVVHLAQLLHEAVVDR